jgi:hypothetical protein
MTSVKGNAKGTVTGVTRGGVLCSVPLADPTGRGVAASVDVVTPLPVVVATERKAIPKLAVPERNSGWVVTSHDTRRTGVAHSEQK